MPADEQGIPRATGHACHSTGTSPAVSSFRVRVPATSANLGSGFDCLGLALGRYNTLTVRPSDRTQVIVRGEGAGRLASDGRNLIYRAITAAYAERAATPPPLLLECENTIPVARGLGSSSSAIAAGLVIARALLDGALSMASLIRVGTRLEGHPDNIVPCLLGGIQVSVTSQGEVLTCPITAPPALRAIVFVPDIPMRTEEARAALPRSVTMKQAVFNISRAALLVAALERGRLDLLATATEDALHQPPRSRIFPAFPHVIQAALSAGAHGAFLSGAGSTVLALGTENNDKVADAMLRAAADRSIGGFTEILDLDQQGATVTET
ncbi:MAG: homoserine kinase [Chloroflexota bacterium]